MVCSMGSENEGAGRGGEGAGDLGGDDVKVVLFFPTLLCAQRGLNEGI
jgi:hypothetical protein